MGKFNEVRESVLTLYKTYSKDTNLSFNQIVKKIAVDLEIDYEEYFRIKVTRWLDREGLRKPKINIEHDDDLENVTTTETNQYFPSQQLSALREDGKIMSIDEYCTFYNIPRDHVRTYKLVSHTGTPYYNIASANVELDLGDSFDEAFVTDFLTKISTHSPNYKNFIRNYDGDDLSGKEKNLMVIDCADIHISKLSTIYETGEEYNIEIAVKRVTEGFYGLLEKAKNFKIDKIMMVVGNDVLHFDNAKSTTTSGTFQDSATSLPTAFNVALDLYVKLIDSVVKNYDVDIVFNPSNHDYISGWMLARTLETWYRKTDNVKVYANLQHRKYYQYGVNMICTSHGDGAKMADFPMLMATESPIMWANTKYRYVYLHHIHHKQVTKFQTAKDYIGVTVEYLRSPSSADRWHADNGYVGAKKAVEAFIHSDLHGQIARISHLF